MEHKVIPILGAFAANCRDDVNKDIFAACPPAVTKVFENESIILPCRAKEEVFHCSWRKPPYNIGVSTEKGSSFELVNFSNDRKNCDLKINSVKEYDEGEWTCAPYIRSEGERRKVSTMLVLKGK